MKDLFNLTTLSGPSGWQEKEAKELSDIVQRRLHHLQVIHSYINLRSRDCLWVSVRSGVDLLEVCVTSQLRAASFTYFGEVLRCPRKCIVTITKVHTARNNIHVEIIRFRQK